MPLTNGTYNHDMAVTLDAVRLDVAATTMMDGG
jgi:hypothetical protein